MTDALLLSRGEGSGNRVSHRQERLVGSRGEHEDVVARIDGIHHDDAQHILLRIVERDDGSAVEILHGRGRIDLGQTRLRLFGGHRRIHHGVGDDQAVRTVRGSGGKDIALGDLLVIQLDHVLSGAIRLMEESEQLVEIHLPRQTIRLPHGQIVAVTSHGHALDIFTVSGACLKSSQTFAELEAALRGDERFLPCNRGVLVNMDEALKLDGDSILLTDGLRFPLRQRNRLDLVNRFSEYQIKRMKRG